MSNALRVRAFLSAFRPQIVYRPRRKRASSSPWRDYRGRSSLKHTPARARLPRGAFVRRRVFETAREFNDIRPLSSNRKYTFRSSVYHRSYIYIYVYLCCIRATRGERGGETHAVEESLVWWCFPPSSAEKQWQKPWSSSLL